MTLREASNARSSTGAKLTLNPRAPQILPMSWPCLRNSLRSPVAKTSAAEGAGPVTFRKRSTRPPSRSTQVKSRSLTWAWQSFNSWWVCCAWMMLRAKRITPAGCMRLSMAATDGVTSVPSNPTISSWPTGFAAAFVFCAGLIRSAMKEAYQECAAWAPDARLLNLLLQLRQQIERGQRGERVELQLADFFYHRLRQRGEDGQLGGSFSPRHLRRQTRFGALVLGQNLARSSDYLLGKTRQFRHLDAIAAVGGAGRDPAEEHNSARALFNFDMVVLYPGELL